MTAALQIQPIGVVVGGRTQPTDDHWTEQAIIRLDPGFPAETVQGLDEFSHLVVVWHFHQASPADVALHARSPRNNPDWPPTGTFVHRNHRLPISSQSASPASSRSPGSTCTWRTSMRSTALPFTISRPTSRRWGRAASSASQHGQVRCSRTTGLPDSLTPTARAASCPASGQRHAGTAVSTIMRWLR